MKPDQAGESDGDLKVWVQEIDQCHRCRAAVSGLANSDGDNTERDLPRRDKMYVDAVHWEPTINYEIQRSGTAGAWGLGLGFPNPQIQLVVPLIQRRVTFLWAFFYTQAAYYDRGRVYFKTKRVAQITNFAT